MKRNIWMMIAILALAVVPASAQLGSLKKMVKKKKPAKTEKEKDDSKEEQFDLETYEFKEKRK